MSENEILSEIRERVVRVETKIDTMTDVQKTANEAEKVANKAMDSSKSAHKRIDKIDKVIFWIATTVIGAVILAILTLIFKEVN